MAGLGEGPSPTLSGAVRYLRLELETWRTVDVIMAARRSAREREISIALKVGSKPEKAPKMHGTTHSTADW